MKNFIKRNQSFLSGTFIILFVIALFASFVIAENYDIQSPMNAEIIRKAKANCEQRGGKHIANPHGVFAVFGKANGQGCSLDYARWEEYKAEYRAENKRLKEQGQ
jgi:hypothetical protein